ncbi:hypothetical protein ASF57_19425 [Methylobacterium sp. Leaf117]|nr:hypothetical protein ASF57_19425 [Methylobacterium sp. Leaf117]
MRMAGGFQQCLGIVLVAQTFDRAVLRLGGVQRWLRRARDPRGKITDRSMWCQIRLAVVCDSKAFEQRHQGSRSTLDPWNGEL